MHVKLKLRILASLSHCSTLDETGAGYVVQVCSLTFKCQFATWFQKLGPLIASTLHVGSQADWSRREERGMRRGKSAYTNDIVAPNPAWDTGDPVYKGKRPVIRDKIAPCASRCSNENSHSLLLSEDT